MFQTLLNTICSLSLFVAGLILVPSYTSAGYDEGASALLRGDFSMALKELRPVADAGDPRAQVLLGAMYRKGAGVPKDATVAASWYRRAAEKGLPNAQYSLGTLYRKGEGVPKDYKQAFEWYRKAAQQNLAAAQTSLGAMYIYGHGVPHDCVKAHVWFSLATNGVSTRPADINLARKGIAVCEAKMTGSQIKEAKRLARQWKPAGN